MHAAGYRRTGPSTAGAAAGPDRGGRSTLDITSLSQNIRRFGARETLVTLGLRAAERAGGLRVLKVIIARGIRDEYLRLDPGYAHGFLDEPTLREFARDDGGALSDAFLDEALGRGDRCYAIRAGGQLASFGWYARGPTPIDDRATLHFGARHVYMYKGYTHRDHRGRRLHAIGMTWALSQLLAEGVTGMVAYVDAANAASLRSCYRMGFEDVGRLYLLRLRGRTRAVADPGCRALGIHVEPAPAAPITAGVTAS